MKLFSRYNRLTLSITVVIFVLAAILYYILLKALLIHELDEILTDKAEQVSSYIKANNWFPENTDLDETTLYYRPVKDSLPVSFDQSAHFDKEEGHDVAFRELSYTRSVNGHRYLITIGKAVEGTSSLLKYIIQITLLVVLLIVLATILLNRYLLRRLWQPFYKTLHVVSSFKVTSNEAAHFDKTNIEEFALLNAHLSQTINDAQKEYRLLKEFTENASHEIQTPLAILRSKLDLFIQSEDLTESQVRLLKAMYDPIKKLSKLNHSLLLLMKIGNRQFPNREKIDLHSRVEEKISQFIELWHARNIKLTTELRHSFIEANPELIDVLLNNLFSNATWHNINGGLLHVSLTAEKLTISNSGPEHPLDSDRVFKRFFKDRPGTSGNGLGLSIIKEIAEVSNLKVQYSFTNGIHSFHLVFTT